MLGEAREVEVDRFTRGLLGFGDGVGLGVAAGERGDGGEVAAFGALVDEEAVAGHACGYGNSEQRGVIGSGVELLQVHLRYPCACG